MREPDWWNKITQQEVISNLPNHYGYEKSSVGGNALGAAPLDSLLIFYIMTCVALYRGTTYWGNPAFASLRGLSPKESEPV